MIDTEAFRKKVIELALQGKLTEQLPSDGDAETLYAQIQEEKAKLVKEGKLKKDKPSAAISEDEILFNIPSNWKWVHLNEIAVSSLGKTLNKSTDKGELCRYLCSINVQWDEINLETVKTARFQENEKEKYKLNRDDLLICEGGDSGRCAIWDSDEEMYYQNALHRVRFFCDINPRLYCYIIEYYKKSGIISLFTKGIGIQHLVQSSLNALWLPLPPLSEQRRIVDKLQTVMDEINIIDELQAKYSNDVVVLKNKIIDAGIQGKLTEQLPEDGDADTLYMAIQEEKAELIKEGKIKKGKILADIADDEIPFEIPNNWKWVRLDSLAAVYNGDRSKNYPNRTEYVREGVAWINTGHITSDGYLDVSTMNYISEEKYNSLSGGKIQEGDMVYCLRGATFGKVARVEPFTEGAIASSLMGIRPIIKESREYIYIFLKSSCVRKQLSKYESGSAQQNIAANDVQRFVIPLPTLEEQKRIIARVEEILNVI